MQITNTTSGTKGVNTTRGTIDIEPGATLVADIYQREKAWMDASGWFTITGVYTANPLQTTPVTSAAPLASASSYQIGVAADGSAVRVRAPSRRGVNLSRWLTALSKWENGTLNRDIRVAFVSSSIFADDAQAGTSAQLTSVANAFANQQRNRVNGTVGFIAADSESFFGNFGGASITQIQAFDSRQVIAGAAISGSQKVQGGGSMNFPDNTRTYALTPQKPFTHARVFYRNNTTGRSVSWACTGGTSGTIATNGTVEIGETTINLGAIGTPGAKTLSFAWAAGNFDLYGVIFYNEVAGKKNIQALDMSFRGATSAALMDDGGAGGGPGSGTADAGRVRVLAKVAPDAIYMDPGIVNDANLSVPYDTAEANYRTLLTAYMAIADVIVVTPPYSAGTGGNSANMDIYVARLLKVCDELGVAVDDYRSDEESWARVDNVPGNTWHPNRDVHLGEGPKGIIARRARRALGLAA